MDRSTTGRNPLEWMFLTLSLVALLLQGAARAQGQEPRLDSPRLAALWQELKAGDAAALDRFWQEIRGKAPLVEPIPGTNRMPA
jgi:hypothetical protein